MRSFSATRRIAARPATIFEALTTETGIAAWWGPDELPVLGVEVDARRGGAFRVRFQTEDGALHEACGDFIEFDPPHRVAMTWRYALGGEADEAGRESLVTIDLAARDYGTELCFTHSGLATQASAASHEQGWTKSLDKLVRRFDAAASARSGRRSGVAAIGALALAAALGIAGAPVPAKAAAVDTAYPRMAATAAYLSPGGEAEIALARSAAPDTIAMAASVMVLGPDGYRIAIAGSNGFTCMVQRAWAGGVDDPDFWNPRARVPICFNEAATRSVLPAYLERTRWVLGGASRDDVRERVRRAVAEGRIRAPETGAMAYMLSRQGYLGDEPAGPWKPHLMLFLPATPPRAWGANLDGSPIFGAASPIEPLTVIFVPLARWSDGSLGPDAEAPHHH